jgi:hypothetical protein
MSSLLSNRRAIPYKVLEDQRTLDFEFGNGDICHVTASTAILDLAISLTDL